MATRMQQRRGTAAQWTAANPILAAGEIGFETDTNKFKMGNGSSTWTALTYFANAAELAAIIDSAPGTMDTLNELAAALGDDPAFFTTTANSLALKAPLASPALTGTPTAPTATPGTNTTQVATTAYADAAVAALVDGAPGALNTLNELAAALDDNSNFANTIITALGYKAPSVSPVFTGTPEAPTAAQNTNTTQIATTAFVSSAVGEVQGNLNTLSSTTSGIQTNIGTINADITTIEGTLSTIEGDITALEASVSTINGDITTIEGDITTLEASVSTLNTNATTTGTTVSGISTSIGTIESDISNIQGDLTTAEGTLATTVSNLSNHTSGTTTVHGIADTAALATKTYADTAGTNAIASANTYADSAVASKAPLASPALTGTPTAPTATAGTNTTQIATTAFVKAEVDAVIAAAPGALNTLDELAAALGDDANYATTVTNALALKAPLAGPTFTGTVALPVASSVTLDGTALSTTLATKADKTASISSKSAAYTIASGDVNSIIEFNSASGASFTIPADNSFWPVGQRLEVLQVAAGQVTIAPAAGVTVNGTPTAKTRTQWSGATIIKRAANIFVVVGDLASS